MFYTLRMDEEEAYWIISLLKMLQIARTLGREMEVTDLDIERAESFISRIRATLRDG